MAAVAMAVQPLVPPFDPYVPSDVSCVAYSDSQVQFPSTGSLLDSLAPGTSSAPVPRRPSIAINTDAKPSNRSPHPSAALPSHHLIPTGTNDAHSKQEGGDSYAQDAPTPPPVPPKSPIRDRPKSLKPVSILAPTDISPVSRVFSHSVSDTGHSHRASFAGTSEGAPVHPAYITSQHMAARSPPAGRLSFSSDALVVHPSSMDPVTHKASSIRSRRNRLHKTRPYPPSPTHSANSSVLSLLFSRAFGSSEHLSRHNSSRSSPSMGDRSYRPTRSLSDGSSKVILSRPSPSSRSSDTTDSSCTASSSASTSLSYASTSLTTPDSSSPHLSPRNSTRTNKLQKKRPLLAPSAYPYALGTSSAALGRSKSTPTGLGQRAPKNRIWSSAEEARIAAEEADIFGAQEPSHWYPSPTDPSSLRNSGLGPIFEVRRKTSSQALSDLACTGLCSTSLAAYASQLALDTDAAERPPPSHDNAWQAADTHGEPFNPYVHCASPSGETSTSITDAYSPSDKPAFPTLEEATQSSSLGHSQTSNGESSSGFAVVGGYLDRSEDAMRRWTLAMADVPEDVLVLHLERLRKESMAHARGRLPGRRSAAPSQIGHGDDELTIDTRGRRSSFFFGGPREMGLSPRSSSRPRFSVGHYDRDLDGVDSDDDALSDEEDEEDWKTARQVLFCCRELVQTERNYQARLRELASTELSQQYASLVARHIPALLRVSETLLAHVIDDPSAWGVSAAFIGCEEELEAAFVAWSSVVGEFFLEDANLRPPRKLKKHPEDTFSDLGHGAAGLGRIMRTRSQVGIPSSKPSPTATRRYSSAFSDIGHGETSSNLGHGGAGMFTAALGTGLAFGLSVASPSSLEVESPSPKSVPGHSGLSRVPTASSGLGLTRAMTAWKRMSMPSSLSNVPSIAPTSPTTAYTHSSHHGHSYHLSLGSTHGHGTPKRPASEQDAKVTARDLAIQPTQRVMRYVLQYRDLLDHTPATSPSRALVERAYESALRIAKKCDRAQAHASFLNQSAHNPKSDKQVSRPQTTTT
ncbi:hypothetical protein L226DRAFT_19447 [Lentinus tigrinus ALCF2SS1-7]|uniref:uncharacterized protein n=1 Tax=Lentinus tigrinus ALCF2SS1-7 TaxID=1328758 RepID=UPI00116638A8|nr:hypothetical protein L226DRAFT_19447 [Lentinus tigrinus ALCF2SS1-7]